MFEMVLLGIGLCLVAISVSTALRPPLPVEAFWGPRAD